MEAAACADAALACSTFLVAGARWNAGAGAAAALFRLSEARLAWVLGAHAALNKRYTTRSAAAG